MSPAPQTLNARRIETIRPPMKEPNIGIRLNTPVIRPKGRARPGSSPKQRQIMSAAIEVLHALMRATVSAFETYFETTFAMRSTTLRVRSVFAPPLKLLQNLSMMDGPSVSINKARTRVRIAAAKKLPTAPMLVATLLPRSLTMDVDRFWM